MTTVDAPYPSYLDNINGLSIIRIERTDTTVTFRNRAGDAVGTFTIRNDPDAIAKAVKRIGAYDVGYKDVLIPDWHLPGVGNDAVGGVILTPSGTFSNCLSWTPDGRYATIGHGTSSPYFTTYRRDGDVFTKLADATGGLPSSSVRGVAWAPNGKHLAVGYASVSSGPTLSLYERNGDALVLSAASLTSFATQPGNVNSVAWSADGLYLAVGHNSAPYINIYKRGTMDNNTFSLLAGPSSLPGAAVNHASFSPDGKFLALASTDSGSGYLFVYRRNGDGFNRISTSGLTMPTGAAQVVRWSPDSQYLAVSHTTTPYISVYKMNANGTALTRWLITTLPPGNAHGLDWSPDGRYLAVGTSTSPYLTVYAFASGAFTKIDDVPSTPGASIFWCEWSPDGKYLGITYNSSALLGFYKSVMAPRSGAASYIP